MPTFSEMIMGNAMTQASGPSAGDAAVEGIKSGVQLAAQVQQIQENKERLAMARQQLEDAKLNKFVEAIEKGQQYSGKAQSNYYNKFLPQYRNMLGLQNTFSDDALSFMTSTPENLARLQELNSMVKNGKMTVAEAIATATDPVKFGDVSPSTLKEWYGQLRESDKVAVENRQEVDKQNREIYSTPYKEGAKKVQDDRVKFLTSDLSEVESKLSGLDNAIKKLDEKKVQTGGTIDSVASMLGDSALAFTNADLKNLRDQVLDAVNLKKKLDSSFSDSAAKQVFDRTFDVKLPPELIVKNLKQLKSTIRQDVRNKFKMYDEYKMQVPGDVRERFDAKNDDKKKKQKPNEVQLKQIKEAREKLKSKPAELKKYNAALKDKYEAFE